MANVDIESPNSSYESIGSFRTDFRRHLEALRKLDIFAQGEFSSSLVDWISDLTYTQITPYEKFPSVEVHEGFYNAYTHSLQQQILDVLAQLPDVPILVTGTLYLAFFKSLPLIWYSLESEAVNEPRETISRSRSQFGLSVVVM